MLVQRYLENLVSLYPNNVVSKVKELIRLFSGFNDNLILPDLKYSAPNLIHRSRIDSWLTVMPY